MNLGQIILLGITQGLTEFFPVSSSAHLTLMQFWTGLQGNDWAHYFLEFINLGTLLALLIFFRHRLAAICRQIFVEHDYRFLCNIIISCVPVVLAGLFFAKSIEHSPFFSSLYTIAIAMGLVGALMLMVEKLPQKSPLSSEEKLDSKRALYIGLAQILALIPGVSRSGSTIIAGRLMGLKNLPAANYSFLVSIPIMLGVLLKNLVSSSDRQFIIDNLGALAISNLCAFIVGLAVIHIAFKIYARRDALKIFGWYRIVAASLILIFLLIQI